MATYSLSGRNLYAYNAGKNWGVSNVTDPTSIPSPQALAAGDKIVFSASSLGSGTEAYLGVEGSMGFNVSSQAGSYDLALRCARVTFTENWKNELRFIVLLVEPNSEAESMGMTEYYVRLQQDSITPSPTPEPAEGTVKVLGENAIPFLKEKMETLVADNLGQAKVLTTADYNYPVDNPTMVALWLLGPGVYTKNDSNVVVRVYNDVSAAMGASEICVVGKPGGTFGIPIIWLTMNYGSGTSFGSIIGVSGIGTYLSSMAFHTPISSLTNNQAAYPLAASQGKVLNDKIGGDLSNLTTTDKTSLINAINELNANLGTIDTALQTLLNGTGA